MTNSKAGADPRQHIITLSILIAVALIDQLSKIWAVGHLTEGATRSVMGNFFKLTLLYNEGGALGSQLGSGTFYLITSLIIIVVIFFFIYTNRHNAFIAWPMALCAGGAAGNLIDRIRTGRVVDFLDFDFFDISLGSFHLERWWKFNVADAAITVGVLFLLVYILFMPRVHPDKTAAVSEPE